MFRHVAERRGVRHRAPASRRVDFVGHHGPQAEGRSTSSCKGLPGLLKRRKVTIVDGTGTLGAGHIGQGDRRRVGRRRAHRRARRSSPPGRCRARSPASTSTARIVVTSDELLSIDKLPGVGRRHRRRRDRLRVRVDDGRPRHAGDDPRGAAEDPPRLRRRRHQGRAALVQEARHRRPAPASRSTGTSPAATAARPCSFGEGETIDGRPGRRVGRPPAARRRRSASTGTAVEVDERGFVEVDERCRTAEPGVYAVGDLIATPQLAHVGFAEGILVDQGHPRRGPASPSTTARCRGASTATPRSPSPATPKQSAKEAGFDVVASKHRYVGNGRALILGEPDGLVKIIAEKRRRRHRRAHPRRAHGRARGSPSSSARATSRSTGRPPSTRSPSSSSPTRRCRELFGEIGAGADREGDCTADGRHHDAPAR